MATETLHRIPRLLGLVNAWLVREDDGLTLVDTALPRSEKAILAAAERLGAPIRRILLTHAHGDHVGSLDALHAALPDAEVLIGERDARLLQKDMTMDPGEPDAKLKGSWPGVETRPTRTLVPGDRVGSLEVHAAPGHTPGHVAFLDVRDRTLLCGDAFATIGGVATCAKPKRVFPLPGFGTWHPATAVASARALTALRPSRLAPGHGKAVADPVPAMERAVAAGS